MALLFFWGIKLFGMGAFKILFYVIMITNIIVRIFLTIGAFSDMESTESTGHLWGRTAFNILGLLNGEGGWRWRNYEPDINYVKPISSLILLIGYVSMLFVFPNFGYPVEIIFWTLCILHSVVAVSSVIGCLAGQTSFNGIVYAVMDIIAVINLSSI